jgi:putative phosphoribosyl transferase
VPVAVEVATYINAPLDTFMVRKLGLPENPERAMGAIASGGTSVLDDEMIRTAGVTPAQLAAITARETAELERRQQFYRGTRPPPRITGRVILVVDDALATGPVDARRPDRPPSPAARVAGGCRTRRFRGGLHRAGARGA